MRILVTGAGGQLGRALTSTLNVEHDVRGMSHVDMDITDLARVRAVVRDFQPEVILHGAALTKVDYCAEHPDEALWINGYGTQHVALAAAENEAALLYISSNEVFDGTHTGGYLEHDVPHPINPYGYSKWIGEQMVRQHVLRHYIVRTSWIFGHGGRNFIHVIRNLAKNGQSLRVVVNDVATPTYTHDLAEGIAKLIQTSIYGTYHLINEGRASRWAFARHILDLSGYGEMPIEKISAAEFRRASTPPEYAVLRNFAAAKRGIVLRPWQEAVAAFLQIEEAQAAEKA